MEQLGEGAYATISAVHDDRQVVRIAGELDISNVAEIETELPALEQAGAPVAIDLSALSFMDSSGIAMLLRTAARTGSVTIRNSSRIVRQIIEATGLSEVLRVER